MARTGLFSSTTEGRTTRRQERPPPPTTTTASRVIEFPNNDADNDNHQTLLLVSDVLQQQPQDGHGPKEGDDIVVGEMVDIDVNHESFSSQVKERYPVGDPFATLNDDGSDDEEEETSGYDNGKEKERNKNKPEITGQDQLHHQQQQHQQQPHKPWWSKWR
mmetsp:Transcript_5692/g.9907  ORF Transcript_5692/g.9907 Transcript_5692/m.9907 type:complete len:161 (-) Transcript_5692:100-582(-)